MTNSKVRNDGLSFRAIEERIQGSEDVSNSYSGDDLLLPRTLSALSLLSSGSPRV